MTITPCFVGCDVSPKTLDICFLRGAGARHFQVPNTAVGIAELIRSLPGGRPERFVLEASGGYEAPVFEALQEAGISVSRLLPQRVRQFARARGQLAKTDRIDAHILALFAQIMRPASNPILPKNQRYLKALTSRRRSLVARRKAEKCQIKQAGFADIQEMVEAALAQTKADITVIETKIKALIEADATWRAQAARIRTMPGIGPVSAMALIAALPELGRVSRTQIAARHGVAPFACERGKWRGRRYCRGGRKELRNTFTWPRSRPAR